VIIVIFSILILKNGKFYIFLERYQLKDFYFLYGFLIFFLLVFLHINDFFLLFLNFEIISLLLYCLIAYNKKIPLFPLI
jgi:NADH:ubiquinone oxidoreductase subunit 2 (subunit N)